MPSTKLSGPKRFVAYTGWLLFGAWIVLAETSFAQEVVSIPVTGIVVDSETGQPLPGVNVFIDGTTIGAATDGTGRFRFELSVLRTDYDLVASMVGYDLYKSRLKLNEREFTIRLIPDTIELEELSVSASNREWLQQLNRLTRMLFSSTPNASLCEISNPEVLAFGVEPVSGGFMARGERPVDIVNRALGYRIRLYDFSLSGEETLLRWRAVMQFTEMAPENDRELRTWERNRRAAYLGSTRHFLTSLRNDTLGKNRFRIYRVDRPGTETGMRPLRSRDVEVKPLPGSPGEPKKWEMFFNGTLLVHYEGEQEPIEYRRYVDQMGLRLRNVWELNNGRLLARDHQTSWFTPEEGSLVFDDAGREYGSFDLLLHGFWAWERLADLLPLDYYPN